MLTAAWVPREAWIEIGSGVRARRFGPYLVPPPDVRTGLAISESYDQAKASGFNDPDAFAVLRHALYAWLPLGAASLLTSRRFPAEEAWSWALHTLALGAEDREAYRAVLAALRRGEDPFRKRPADASWSSLVAEYRTVYGLSFEDVMREPWLAFVWQMEYMARQRARASVDMLRASPYGGAKSISELFSQAYPAAEPSEAEKLAQQHDTLGSMRRDLGAFDTSNFRKN